MTDYPRRNAAFINAIAEEGTKAEAVEWLQKTWDELCAVREAAATVGVGVHRDILDRYELIIHSDLVTTPRCQPNPGTSLSHLLWMIGELRTDMPSDKASRWLGFIQGCLVMRGMTSVQSERDFTRPYFTGEAAA